MSYRTKQEIMERVQEHHNIALNLGYEVIGTFLQGSFNYGENMSDEQSDIDTKCLVIPTFSDFCLNKPPISTTYICDNNEHIDLKDFRLYLNCFKKQNINFVEILFTDYCIINPKYASIVNQLIENREAIGHYDNYASLNCICGMGMEKLKALEHPYPATKDKIEKYGFDGKQLSHIVRIHEFMSRWIMNVPYSECLISKQQEYLRDLKRNKNITLDKARIMAKSYTDSMKVMKDRYMESNSKVINNHINELFENISVEILKTYLKGVL